MKQKWPQYVYGTKRNFMKVKRRQIRRLCNFIDNCEVMLGCAYLPKEQFEKLNNGVELIREVRNELKSWWEKA